MLTLMQLRREYIVRKRRDLNLRRVNFPGGTKATGLENGFPIQRLEIYTAIDRFPRGI